MRLPVVVFLVYLAAIAAAVQQASGAPMPPGWHAPRWWLPQAVCIHEHEGAWNAATGNGYEGGMQFLRSTWLRAGGRVDGHGHWASVASPREQLYRAWVIYRSHGGSWSEWGTAGACGLR